MEFLSSTRRLFAYYRTLAEGAIAQLEPEQLYISQDDDSNSIDVIMRHMAGNMLSRWTDFLTSDGEKPWRDRDEEFALADPSLPHAHQNLMTYWNSGWDCLFAAIDSLKADDLDQTVYIRNEGHSVTDAVLRQLAHYSYHVGQIVYAAKMLKTGEWKSLSIPRNQSAEFNSSKFSQERHIAHFTDGIDLSEPKKNFNDIK